MSDLITKYRPEKFSQVLGQDQAVASIRDILAKGTSRSFILTGNSGCGKTTLARIIASKVNCLPANLIEVDAASNTGVDDMRALTQSISYSPMGGGARVYILDECHRSSKQAWDSLLKNVEEPPAGVYWIFCTTDLSKVPVTIRNRCTIFTLKPVSKDLIFSLVEQVAKLEGYATPENVLSLIVDRCEGSPRWALKALAQCSTCTDIKQASSILSKAVDDETGEAIELCRGLISGMTWAKAMALLKTFEDVDAESVRYTVLGYMTKVALDTKSEDKAAKVLNILSAFSEPYPQVGTSVWPIILSLGRIYMGG